MAPPTLPYDSEQSQNAKPDGWFFESLGVPLQQSQPQPEPVSKRPGHYTSLFAEPTTDADWEGLGRQREARPEEGEPRATTPDDKSKDGADLTPTQPRNYDEARVKDRAEEIRAQQAAEALEQRKRDLEEIQRQKQRDVERESKRASGEQHQVPAAVYKPKRPEGAELFANNDHGLQLASLTNEEYREMQAKEARKLREHELKVREEQKKRDEQRAAQRSASPEVEEDQPKQAWKARAPAGFHAALLSVDDYQARQAAEARELRELELKVREEQKKRDEERAAQRSASPEVEGDQPKQVWKARAPATFHAALASVDDYQERQAADARELRELELKVRKEQEERDAQRAMAEAEPGRGGKVYKPPVGKYSAAGLDGPAGPGPNGPGYGKGHAMQGFGFSNGYGAPKGYGPPNGYMPGPGFGLPIPFGPPGSFGGASMGPMAPMGGAGPLGPWPGPYPGFGPMGPGHMETGFGPAPFPGYRRDRQRSVSRRRPVSREPYLDAEAYREKQAEEARELRRLELEQIEAQNRALAEREAQVAQRQAILAA